MSSPYLESVRVIRALVDGGEAFRAALESADLDARDFASFLTRQKLVDWVGPALADPRVRQRLPYGFAERVASHCAACRQRNALLSRVAVQAKAQLESREIECLLLKGLYLAQRFYGDLQRRHQNDLDLLVRRSDFEPALDALAEIGFDVSTDLDSGNPMSLRLRKIRRPVPGRAPHAVRVRRGGAPIDLHWCLRSRSLRRLDERALWAAREKFSLGGVAFETLSDDYTLTFLMLSICTEVKRGTSRARQFLDLYLALRQLDSRTDWEAFFERRRREGLHRVCATAAALLLVLWDCGAEIPRLVRALESRRRQVELRDEAEALALVTRPRGNPEGRTWRRRVYPRSRIGEVLYALTFRGRRLSLGKVDMGGTSRE